MGTYQLKGVFTSNSYSAVHKWLSRWHKKKKTCEHCGSTQFLEWALIKGLKHGHDPSRYKTLCSSCHKKYDYTKGRIEKLRETLKGRKITWWRKISEANKGRKLTDDQKRKISEYQKLHPRPRNKKGQFYKRP